MATSQFAQTMTDQWLIHHEIERQSVWRGDDIAFAFEGAELTYQAFYERVKRAANALHSNGVGEGDVVIAFAKNHVDLFTFFFACSMTGTIYSPISTFQSVSNLRYMCNQLSPRLCVYTMDEAIVDGNLGVLREALPDVQFVSLDEKAMGGDSTVNAFLADNRDEPEMSRGRPSPETAHNVFWTSGTTGRPKGTVRDHRATLYGIDSYVSVFPYREANRRLTASDMMFPAPYLQHGITTLMAGGQIVILREFSPEAVCRSVEQWDINTMMLTFTVSNLLTEYVRENNTDLTIEYLHAVLSSAKQAQAAFDLCEELYHFYAISEGGFPLMNRVESPIRSKPALGRPLPHYDIRLQQADTDNGAIPDRLPLSDEHGEIIIRGAGTMNHYLGEAPSTDGWIATGDVGALNEDGEIVFIDRLDNRIRSGGVNVYPNEIEAPLNEHPAVEDIVIVGADDDRLGDRICAIVVPTASHRDHDELADELDDYCRTSEQIAPQLRPREYAFIESSKLIPTGAIGKVDRDAIATRFFTR